MTHFEHYKSGDLFGIRYLFDVPGDGLPNHRHDRSTSHNIVVLHGAVRVHGPSVDKIVEAPSVFDFDWSAEHQVTALVPETVILNLFLFGHPDGYQELPDTERKGTFHVGDF